MSLAFVIAVAVVLGLLLFLFREMRRAPGPAQWGHVPRWAKRLRVSFAAIVLFLGLIVFWAFFIESNLLVVREQTIEIENWPQQFDGLRVAVISDIHVGASFITDEKLRTIVERTNERQPELIVILGDYMTRAQIQPKIFGATLKGFSAPLGTYSVLGNHDWWFSGDMVRRGLEENGIKVLENEVLQLNARGTSLWLVGLIENNHHLFVTTGIGTSIVPVRFGVTPEIVLLTLKSK